ncbi:3-hydroxyacyl-CoA dehydrogenase family protein [Chitinophaga qingshengii]|uniref:3-hydroxyacyl-CoA dehydrogenase family protein n=1 Tax=Chitinophaga qingshengii TaxID=1569794 RepID=A0ABR7TG66_9BACT|nr:3-hydroxyacyl-CoA dehydrogenase family protein [Chitinophaga qingshengii]MBC9929392.1 3-hydroxyacyl-CoA dehydrogenase family protein [Chitinophaga qingshengii]
MINTETNDVIVGVVGLGLMGCSITACLLMAGHRVIAVAPIPDDLLHASKRIAAHLHRSFEEGITRKDPVELLQALVITEDYTLLQPCGLVIESTIENLEIKKAVYNKIETVIDPGCLLVSNTSAIPISMLQKLTKHPSRFLGLHWAEPSHTTRFLEVICGDDSDVQLGEYLYQLSHRWGKEPILVRKDIRGFVTNRLMYAMYREAFYLVENGYATVEDVDRSCRNNAGYFMTFVGIFRWMDLTGVPAYHNVMKDLFPDLNNSTAVPRLITDIVNAGGRGVANAKGFYEYTEEEAKLWEETFADFSYKIRELALQYPADVIARKLAARKTAG